MIKRICKCGGIQIESKLGFTSPTGSIGCFFLQPDARLHIASTSLRHITVSSHLARRCRATALAEAGSDTEVDVLAGDAGAGFSDDDDDGGGESRRCAALTFFRTGPNAHLSPVRLLSSAAPAKRDGPTAAPRKRRCRSGVRQSPGEINIPPPPPESPGSPGGQLMRAVPAWRRQRGFGGWAHRCAARRSTGWQACLLYHSIPGGLARQHCESLQSLPPLRMAAICWHVHPFAHPLWQCRRGP